ncbi:hypothetical protein D3C72_1728200 [compost metagenome]
MAPDASACPGSSAAGWTRADVPMLNIRSHRCAACTAALQESAGRLSPNHTTPGRTGAEQCAQAGGAMRRPVSCSSATSAPSDTSVAKAYGDPQTEQRGACRLPCRCVTRGLPARSCRSSTFWVMTASSGTCRASSAMARCAALGMARRTCARRHSYQPHTISGCALNASGVASACASKRDHRPVSAPRKVAMPLSAETPAPVKTTTRRAWRSACASAGGIS